MMDKEKLIKLNNVRQIISSINYNNYKQYNLNKIVSNICDLRILLYVVFIIMPLFYINQKIRCHQLLCGFVSVSPLSILIWILAKSIPVFLQRKRIQVLICNCISAVCLGKMITAGGYHWEYL